MADFGLSLASPRACVSGTGVYVARAFFTDNRDPLQVELGKKVPSLSKENVAIIGQAAMQQAERGERDRGLRLAAMSILRVCLNLAGHHLVPKGKEMPRLERHLSVIFATPTEWAPEPTVDTVQGALVLPSTQEELSIPPSEYVAAGFSPQEHGSILVARFGRERIVEVGDFISSTQGVKAV